MLNKEENTIARLKQILASRYGKGLELRPLTDVSSEGAEGHLLKGEDLYIPLRVQDAFLGTAVVPYAGELSTENQTQITQVVRMVLEPALYRDFLERREDNLRSLTEEEVDPSNLRMLNMPIADESGDESVEPLRMFSSIVHLHGHEKQRIKQAALLLHEMTGRWTFAPFENMEEEIRSSLDLMNLGALTLFIEDIETLSPEKQQLVLDYVSVPRSDREPMIVTASLTSPDEVMRRGKLISGLADEMVINALELDRAPLTERGLREVLRLMFFGGNGKT